MTPTKKNGTHHPKGLPLIYEDSALLVVDKPSGLLSMGSERDKIRTAHTLVNDYVRKGDPRSRNRAFIVHRLDRDTSGLLLFARSEPAKCFLQAHWDETRKQYLAVVHGVLTAKEGIISTYLAENSAHNVYSTGNETTGKLARTAYRVLQENKGLSLLEIDLLTGRKHQIRVHFSEAGHPVVGDRKYGRDDASRYLLLHSRSLDVQHPTNGRRLVLDTPAPGYLTRLFGTI